MARKKVTPSLESLIEEFCQVSHGLWSEASRKKHRGDFDRYLAFLRRTGRPLTLESLELPTLLAYVEELSTSPVARGVWRGDRTALAAAAASAPPDQRRSRNTINSYMRPIHSLCIFLVSEGVLTFDPFARAKRRGGANPLLPSEDTPAKGATLQDLEQLRKGAAGNDAIDLRDRAIIELMLTTGARAGSICKLRVDDLDLERGFVTFAKAKGGKTYVAILQPEARAALLRYLNRGRARLLPAYPVRGYAELRVGDDPGWLFLSRRDLLTFPKEALETAEETERRRLAAMDELPF